MTFILQALPLVAQQLDVGHGRGDAVCLSCLCRHRVPSSDAVVWRALSIVVAVFYPILGKSHALCAIDSTRLVRVVAGVFVAQCWV